MFTPSKRRGTKDCRIAASAVGVGQDGVRVARPRHDADAAYPEQRAASLLPRRCLADESYRRRIGRQLNKGENLHALQRSPAYAGQGALRG